MTAPLDIIIIVIIIRVFKSNTGTINPRLLAVYRGCRVSSTPPPTTGQKP